MLKLKFPLAATALLGFAASAYAEPPVVPENADACPNPNASCPAPEGTTSTTTGTTTTTTTEGSTAMNEPQPAPQTTTNNYNYNAPPPPPPTTTESESPWEHQLGFSVGGGVDDFANGTQRRATDIGGSWDARLTIGTRSFIAAEISYIGSAQTAHLGVIRGDKTLYGNGAQGALRLNLTGGMLPMQPFLFGGGAWRHYSTTGNSNISEDVWEIPAGAGIAAYVSDLMIDVRGEYRFAQDDRTLSRELGLDRTGSSFARWGVSGNVGYVF
jgi:hypothetical protein